MPQINILEYTLFTSKLMLHIYNIHHGLFVISISLSRDIFFNFDALISIAYAYKHNFIFFIFFLKNKINFFKKKIFNLIKRSGKLKRCVTNYWLHYIASLIFK